MVVSAALVKRMSWGYGLAFLTLSTLLVGSVWAVPYLPTNDGPESVLAVYMENHFADPGTIYRDVFTPAPQFAGRGFTILFEPLEELFGWERGLQVALSVIVLLEAWGLVALVRRLDPRRLPVAFLGFPLALSWSLYMGFFAFVIASGASLFLLAFTLDPLIGGARRVVVALLLLGLAFLHMFPAILAGVVILAVRVATAPRGGRLVEAGKTAAMGAPAAGLVVAAFLVARRVAATVPFSSSFAFASVHDVLTTWPRTLAPGPLPRALAVTALVGGLTVAAAVRSTRASVPARDRALSVVAVVLLAAALFAPRDIPGWQCFSERFVWLGVMLLLASARLERLRANRAGAATAALFVASFAATAAAYPFHKRLASSIDDALAGLSAHVRRERIWLPVSLEPSAAPRTPSGDIEVPLLVPLHHIGSLYTMTMGGLTPYTFASNPATWAFSLRPDGIRPPAAPPLERTDTILGSAEFQLDRAFRQREENELATYGMFFEGVLVTGARPEDITLWKKRGFVADWERGSVLIAHFEPCVIDVRVPAGLSAPALDIGVGPETLAREARPAVTRDAEGTHIEVPGAPCGRVWVRPRWLDAGGGASFCDNAGPTGELTATVTRSHGRFDCARAHAPPD